MESFLKFILITIFVFWLIGILGRVLFRAWVRRKQREYEQFMGGAQQRQQRQGGHTRNNEGEVSIHRTAAPERTIDRSVGDYVDFEEVEEEADNEAAGCDAAEETTRDVTDTK